MSLTHDQKIIQLNAPTTPQSESTKKFQRNIFPSLHKSKPANPPLDNPKNSYQIQKQEIDQAQLQKCSSIIYNYNNLQFKVQTPLSITNYIPSFDDISKNMYTAIISPTKETDNLNTYFKNNQIAQDNSTTNSTSQTTQNSSLSQFAINNSNQFFNCAKYSAYNNNQFQGNLIQANNLNQLSNCVKYKTSNNISMWSESLPQSCPNQITQNTDILKAKNYEDSSEIMSQIQRAQIDRRIVSSEKIRGLSKRMSIFKDNNQNNTNQTPLSRYLPLQQLLQEVKISENNSDLEKNVPIMGISFQNAKSEKQEAKHFILYSNANLNDRTTTLNFKNNFDPSQSINICPNTIPTVSPFMPTKLKKNLNNRHNISQPSILGNESIKLGIESYNCGRQQNQILNRVNKNCFQDELNRFEDISKNLSEDKGKKCVMDKFIDSVDQIIPSLIQAVKSMKKKEIDILKFLDLQEYNMQDSISKIIDHLRGLKQDKLICLQQSRNNIQKTFSEAVTASEKSIQDLLSSKQDISLNYSSILNDFEDSQITTVMRLYDQKYSMAKNILTNLSSTNLLKILQLNYQSFDNIREQIQLFSTKALKQIHTGLVQIKSTIPSYTSLNNCIHNRPKIRRSKSEYQSQMKPEEPKLKCVVCECICNQKYKDQMQYISKGIPHKLNDKTRKNIDHNFKISQLSTKSVYVSFDNQDVFCNSNELENNIQNMQQKDENKISNMPNAILNGLGNHNKSLSLHHFTKSCTDQQNELKPIQLNSQFIQNKDSVLLFDQINTFRELTNNNCLQENLKIQNLKGQNEINNKTVRKEETNLKRDDIQKIENEFQKRAILEQFTQKCFKDEENIWKPAGETPDFSDKKKKNINRDRQLSEFGFEENEQQQQINREYYVKNEGNCTKNEQYLSSSNKSLHLQSYIKTKQQSTEEELIDELVRQEKRSRKNSISKQIQFNEMLKGVQQNQLQCNYNCESIMKQVSDGGIDSSFHQYNYQDQKQQNNSPSSYQKQKKVINSDDSFTSQTIIRPGIENKYENMLLATRKRSSQKLNHSQRYSHQLEDDDFSNLVLSNGQISSQNNDFFDQQQSSIQIPINMKSIL